VALDAIQPGVVTNKRKLRQLVILQPEYYRNEPVLQVTGGTIAAIWPGKELPIVFVSVTIGAPLVRKRTAEVGAFMALAASGLSVPADQWEFRRRMIDLAADLGMVPAGSRVTRLAILRKGLSMWIAMAGLTRVEFDSRVLRVRF